MFDLREAKRSSAKLMTVEKRASVDTKTDDVKRWV